MATKLIDLVRLDQYDGLIKEVIAAADATKYQTITYNSSTRVISFWKNGGSGDADFTVTLPADVDISGKADKVTGAVAGHVANLDANGNLVDSGHALSEYTVDSTLAAVAKSGAAADVSVADAGGYFEGATVETALQEVGAALDDVADEAVVTVEKQATAETGYVATYVIKQNNVQVGEKINIPKDFVVKSATVKTCTVDDDPVTGYVVGDKYVDLEINVKEGAQETSQHLYFLAKELAPVYSGAANPNGVSISIDAQGVISATVNSLDGTKLVAGSVAKTALATGVQSSLDLADSAVQPGDLATVATSGLASDVEYTAAAGATPAVSVAQAISALETKMGADSVSDQIDDAIATLDSSTSATAGYALTGITITDGLITGKTEEQFMLASDYSIATQQDIANLFA